MQIPICHSIEFYLRTLKLLWCQVESYKFFRIVILERQILMISYTQSAKLYQNMFAKFIGFSLKSRFLNNCIICNDDVIIQVFKTLENSQKKNY